MRPCAAALVGTVFSLVAATTDVPAAAPPETPALDAEASLRALDAALAELGRVIAETDVDGSAQALRAAAADIARLRREAERAATALARARSAVEARAEPGRKPRLGALVADMTDSLRAYFGAEAGRGVLVMSVNDGSAAATAGLAAGDVVLALAGEPVTDVAGLRRLVLTAEAGEHELEVLRRGQNLELDVALD